MGRVYFYKLTVNGARLSKEKAVIAGSIETSADSSIRGSQRAICLAGALVASLLPMMVSSPRQVDAAPLQAIGIQLGGASTNRSLEESGDTLIDETGGVWGWAGGGYVQWDLSIDKVSLLTEAWWIEKGFSRRVGGTGRLVDTEDQYMSLPIQLLYDPTEGVLRPFAFAGPSIEYLVDAGIDEGLPRWSGAFNLGGGVHYQQRLEFRIRYTHDISDSSGAGPAGPERVRNRGVLLTGGLRFAH